MPSPKIFLRITNNSEKAYAEKLGRFFSGFFFRANFFESSSGLIAGIAVKSAASSVGYALDPMTYAFAVDPSSGTICRDWRKIAKADAEKQLRADLKLSINETVDQNWIRPVQNGGPKDGGKVEILGMKQAFRNLADKTLGPLASLAGMRALTPADFSTQPPIQALVANSIDYQLSAVKSRLSDDGKKPFEELIPSPSLVFCPYFRISNPDWMSVQKKLWKEFDQQFSDPCATIPIFTTLAAISSLGDQIIEAAARSKAPNIAVWIDDFDEEDNSAELAPYAAFLRSLLQTGRDVINLYGSGYSLMLASRGLSTVVSCGHGESKPMEPLSSGGFPVSKYYIPSLRSRRGITETVTLLRSAGIGTTRDSFLRDVCSCAICKDAIKSGVSDLISYYGELGDPKETRRGFVQFPTGKALERCKFHYLLTRINEHRKYSKLSPAQMQNVLDTDCTFWADVRDAGGHLGQWLRVGI